MCSLSLSLSLACDLLFLLAFLKGIVPAKAAKMAAKSVTLMTEKLINIKVRDEAGTAAR